jgi:hypothetical protein
MPPDEGDEESRAGWHLAEVQPQPAAGALFGVLDLPGDTACRKADGELEHVRLEDAAACDIVGNLVIATGVEEARDA